MSKIIRTLALTALLVLGGTATAQAAAGAAGTTAGPVGHTAVTVQAVRCMSC